MSARVVKELTQEQRDTIVIQTKMRFRRSIDYVQPIHDSWVRYWKLYRNTVDTVDDSDEISISLSYAFGIVQNILAKVTEPIMRKVPILVKELDARHVEQAKKFLNIMRTYLGAPAYQRDYTEAGQEVIVTGNTYEIDEWAFEFVEGRIWKFISKNVVVKAIKGFLDSVLPVEASKKVLVKKEVPHTYAQRVGYKARFPENTDIFPEPSIKRIQDMSWVIEQQRSVHLKDLEAAKFINPDTGEPDPVYYLDELKRELNIVEGDTSRGAVKPEHPFEGATGQGDDIRELHDIRRSDAIERDSRTDEHTLHIIREYRQDAILVIAQGRFLIGYEGVPYGPMPFQKPIIPIRHRIYTPNKKSFFGDGAIAPIEHELYELNDIHRLSMRNWERIINKMIAYHPEKIPFPDDFLPRAGGRIRVKARNIHDAIMAVDHADVGPSMNNMQSSTKGGIEFATAFADFSPGTGGTKAQHKTAAGLSLINTEISNRHTMTRRIFMADKQEQFSIVEMLFSQFQVFPAPFTAYGPDGQTSAMEYNHDDISTEGKGFLFVIEQDPAAGDDNIARELAVVMMDRAIAYEQFRVASGQPMKVANVERRYVHLLNVFGIFDTSQDLKDPSGSIDPDKEFELLVQGIPVKVNRDEPLIEHWLSHLAQRDSPVLAEMIEKGQVSPEGAANLDDHIAETQLLIGQILRNPEAVLEERKREAILNAPKTDSSQPGGRPQIEANA